jgi:molybdopterin synthase sulfur carrier subunit
MATVRFFAAAADVVGVAQRSYDVTSVAQLREAVSRDYGVSAARVIARCSLLISGIRAESDAAPIVDSDTVDVLPPFAGG